MSKRGKQTEAEIQIECVAWIRREFPSHPFAYINNNARSIAQGRRNKALGTLKGAPDCFLFASSGKYHGLAEKGPTSDSR